MLIRNLLFIGLCFLLPSTLLAQQISDFKLSADLAMDENINENLVTSSNGELVAYLVQEGESNVFNRRLYVVKTDSNTDAVLLAPNLTDGFFTSDIIFSPDGTKVAFIYGTSTDLPLQEFEYYVAPINGGDAVLIDDSINIVNTTLGVDFKFSDDGATLFYIAATTIDNTNGLFKRAVNAQSERQRLDQLDLELTNVTGRIELTSDGSQIIYSANSSAEDGAGGGRELFIVNVDGGSSVRLDEDGMTSIEITYVESEELVLYQAVQGDLGNQSLFSVPLNGQNRINISQGVTGSVGAYQLTFNAEKAVFFVASGTNNALFSASLDGSNLVSLSPPLSVDQTLNEFYVSPTRNQAIIEIGTVNVSGQPQILVDFENAPTFRTVSPNSRSIGDVIFSSSGINIAYKMLQPDPDSIVTFDSRFYVANLNSGQFQQLATSNELTINIFEPFNVLGNESVIFTATNANSETNLYAATREGQDAIQLNRNLPSVNSSLDDQAVSNFLLLPSQNTLLYIGNTADQNKRELFAIKISERFINPQELCLPVRARNNKITVICI